jgi:prephenate dehydrogenase
MHFNRVSILGVGLIGGSVGLALKSIASGCKINGYGHQSASIHQALQLGAIDEGFDNASRAVRDADLVLICTPVASVRSILQEIADNLAPSAIVSDVASTKRSVVSLAGQILAAGQRFVGSHPMAGSAMRGVQAARADLFRDAVCITTPTPTTDPSALAEVERFWVELGMSIVRCLPEEHDRYVATISHLPHVVAAALMRMQPQAAIQLAGSGFLDTTRIAAGDPSLWTQILSDNADNVRQAIDQLQQELTSFKAMLEPGAAQSLQNWLHRAAAARSQLRAGRDPGS